MTQFCRGTKTCRATREISEGTCGYLPTALSPCQGAGLKKKKSDTLIWKIPTAPTLKAPVDAFQSPPGVEVNVCRSSCKLEGRGEVPEVVYALRQQGFQVAPGLLLASTSPLFTFSQELVVMLAPNMTCLEGKAHAKWYHQQRCDARRQGTCEFGNAGSSPAQWHSNWEHGAERSL